MPITDAEFIEIQVNAERYLKPQLDTIKTQVHNVALKLDAIVASLEAGGGSVVAALTEQQVEDAAFRGAQRAEKE